MSNKIKAQISMDDKVVNNPELEKLLEEWQKLKQSVSGFRKADKKAKAEIQKVQMPLPFRIGRFIIGRQVIAAKSIAFETAQSERITIKTVDED